MKISRKCVYHNRSFPRKIQKLNEWYVNKQKTKSKFLGKKLSKTWNVWKRRLLMSLCFHSTQWMYSKVCVCLCFPPRLWMKNCIKHTAHNGGMEPKTSDYSHIGLTMKVKVEWTSMDIWMYLSPAKPKQRENAKKFQFELLSMPFTVHLYHSQRILNFMLIFGGGRSINETISIKIFCHFSSSPSEANSLAFDVFCYHHFCDKHQCHSPLSTTISVDIKSDNEFSKHIENVF